MYKLFLYRLYLYTLFHYIRPQLLQLRVAKTMVRHQQLSILLLWQWKRFVFKYPETYPETPQIVSSEKTHQCVFSSLHTDKQQKGSFYITEYSVQMVTNARRDSKKNACFELAAPGRRTFQVWITAGSNGLANSK